MITSSCTSAKGSVSCVTDFSKQLIDAMQQYTGNIGEEIETALQAVGKEAAAKLRDTSPKRSGKYRKGWKVTAERRNGEIIVTVHNKHYRLTHLLEHGHKTRSGGRAAAAPHIAPVEEWAEKEAIKAIEKAVKG